MTIISAISSHTSRLISAFLLVTLTGTSTHAGSPDPERLNNMVLRLLHVDKPQIGTYHFTMPHDGFIWLTLDADVYSFGRLHVMIDDQTEENAAIITTDPRLHPSESMEAMQYLRAGEHSLTISGHDLFELRSITVNAIPQIHYWSYAEQRPYQVDSRRFNRWEWLKPNILPNYTHIMVIGRVISDEQAAAALQPVVDEWRSMGRKVFHRAAVPHRSDDNPPTGEALREATYQYYKKILSNPAVDGVMADEFLGDHPTQTPLTSDWVAGITRAMKEFPNKEFHAAMTRAYTPNFDSLVQAAIDNHNIFLVPQHYYTTPATLDDLMNDIEERSIKRGLNAFEESAPGIQQKTCLLISYASHSPDWSGDTHTNRNFKNVIDTQLHLAATNPAFKDMMGIGFWKSSSVNEEMLRFASAAVRHYFLEGNTDSFYHEPYELTHLHNGSFEEGLTGWELLESERNSTGLARIGIDTPFTGLPSRRVPNRDYMLAMRVSPDAPNILYQQINDLQPAKLYSFEFYSTSKDKPGEKRILPVAIEIDNVRILDQQLQVYGRVSRPRSDNKDKSINSAWNHHYIIFEALGETADLTIYDWRKDEPDPRFSGETLLYDYFKIQPYFTGEPHLP